MRVSVKGETRLMAARGNNNVFVQYTPPPTAGREKDKGDGHTRESKSRRCGDVLANCLLLLVECEKGGIISTRERD